MHSNNHLGISLMGEAHVAGASPHMTYAYDTHYPWQTEEEEVVAGDRPRVICVAEISLIHDVLLDHQNK